MKKSDIMELVASECGTLEVNPFCYLRRWTVSALGSEVDKLALEFRSFNGMGRFEGSTVIESREYAGIKAEMENAIRSKLQEVADYLCTAMQNGYTV